MKKIFFFAAAMMAAVSVNAETVFDWANNVGTTTMFGTTVAETVKVKGTATNCLSLKNAFKDNNGVKIEAASGAFQVGDILNVEFCLNNSDASKTAILGVYAADSTELTYAAANNTYSADADASTLQYALTAEQSVLLLGRKSGNTKCCITKLEVIRGGEVVIEVKAAKPIFSVASGNYYDPFKVAIESSKADKIFYSINEVEYVEYTDSIEIAEYDTEFKISAYATIEGGENSDVAEATYKLQHFVARPVFNARKTIDLAGITAEDIQILSGDNATIGTYTMDGKPCPAVNYVHTLNGEGKDSVMIISFKGRDGLTLRYKNGDNKANALKVPANYVQADSKNYEMYVDGVQGGDTVVFVVTAKGSAPTFDHNYSTACYLTPYQPEDDTDPCFTDGAVYTASDARVENDYIGWTNLVYVVQEGHTKIRLKETANGFRIAKIQLGAYRGEAPEHQAISNVNAAAKAVKVVENGQLVIIKNGVKYNALGAQL